MIGVVLAQIAGRWGQALTLLVLSAAVTAAAVSAPAFAGAIDEATLENELETADSSELVVSLPGLSATTPEQQGAPPPEGLAEYRRVRSELSAFTPVTTTQIQVQGLDPDASPDEADRMLARAGFCEWVTFEDGRCPVGSREAALPAGLAADVGAAPGDEVVLTPVRSADDTWEADGPPSALTIVGVFEANDRTDPYWRPQDPLGQAGLSSAILTNATVLETLPHGRESIYLDAILPAGSLTPERLPAIRSQLRSAERQLEAEGPIGAALFTDLPQLLDRIEGHGDQARALLPIAAAPLVALCWFVVYLAVGQGVAGRRTELGVVAIRGAKWRMRALVVAAEPLLPILAGIPVGLALSRLLVAVVGPGNPGFALSGIDTPQLIAAGLAAAGAVVAAALAVRRELASSPVELLRQISPRRRRLALRTAEVVAIALGGVVVADLWLFDGDLVGVMVVAPVVIMLAVAIVAAAAMMPLLGLLGRWALRAGRLAPAMAALHLARQAGTGRLLVVLALVLASLGFAVASMDVAAQGRVAEAQRLLGASRVLDVSNVGRGELLRAVRAADPDGEYAMAAISTPASSDDPPAVALDSTRLARTALWSERYGALDAAEVAGMLRPPAPDPVIVEDGELVAELSTDSLSADRDVTVTVSVAPVSGNPVSVTLGPATTNRQEYEGTVIGCSEGCRVVGLSVAAEGDDASRISVTMHGLTQDGTEVLPSEWYSDSDAWRNPEDVPDGQHLWLETGGDGLTMWRRSAHSDVEYDLLAVDAPYPIPVVAAGQSPPANLLTGIDGQLVRLEPQARIGGLPGVGGRGVLMDLEYAERHTAAPGAAVQPQVWLAAGAPDEVIQRLEDEGLVINADRTFDSVQGSLDESGAAMALTYFGLSAGVASLLGLGALALVAAVDRRSWGRALSALRRQGVPERTATSAALWSYAGVVAAAAVVGALAAGAAWLTAGDRLPLGVDETLLVSWPQWAPVLAPWAAAVVLLFGAAAVGAWWQRGRTWEVG